MAMCPSRVAKGGWGTGNSIEEANMIGDRSFLETANCRPPDQSRAQTPGRVAGRGHGLKDGTGVEGGV